MSANSLYYRASGRFSPGGLVVGLLIAVAAGAALGVIYGLLTQVNPFIYVTILATMGLAFGVGMAAAFAVRGGRVRNLPLAALIGLIAGGTAVVSSWVAYLNLVLYRADVAEMVFDPEALWTLLNLANQTGLWSIKDLTPTGGFLWALWGIEAAIIVGAAIWLAAQPATEPFCEDCNEWTDDEMTLAMGVIAGDPAPLKRQLEAGDVDGLRTLGPAQGSQFTQVKLSTCPRCSKLGFLSVDTVEVTFDDKGNQQNKERPIARNLVMRDEGLARARGLRTPQPEPEPVG